MKYAYSKYIVLALFVFSSCLLFGQKDDNEGEPVKTKSFQVHKGGTLQVDVSGDIRISPWSKDEVFVKVRADDADALEDLSMTSQGDRVIVENSRYGYGSEDIKYTINVPTHFNMDLRTAGGTIAIDNPLVGTVDARTSGGDVTTGDVTGNVDLHTSGGDIKTGNTDGDLTVKTSGGEIYVGSVSGLADISTSGGDIRVRNVKKSLRARTSGGNITLSDVGGEADVSTSGGNINAGKVSGSATLSTAGGDIDLESATGTVKAKTAGGNIHVLDVRGAIDARTAGGDVEAELIPSGKGGSRLSTAAGEIRLSIPPDAKATINARIRVQGYWGRHRSDDENYSIISDFKADSYEKSHEDREIRATYTLNGGGEPITLETTNANIRILKLGSRVK